MPSVDSNTGGAARAGMTMDSAAAAQRTPVRNERRTVAAMQVAAAELREDVTAWGIADIAGAVQSKGAPDPRIRRLLPSTAAGLLSSGEHVSWVQVIARAWERRAALGELSYAGGGGEYPDRSRLALGQCVLEGETGDLEFRRFHCGSPLQQLLSCQFLYRYRYIL